MGDDADRSLDALRAAITRCDAALLERLAERRGLVLEVARAKLDQPRPVRDRGREEALLARLVRLGRETHGLDPSLITAVFHAIIEDSVLTQQAWFEARANPTRGDAQPRVAFLGERGSYSQLAARRFFARRRKTIQELGLERFVDVVDAVYDGVAEFGVLPVENSTTGSITEVFDLLQRSTVHIVGEVTHDVVHALLVPTALADVPLEAIERVHGHPQALQQCREWLERRLPGAERRLAASTSAAMAQAATEPDAAAIGSTSGGALYALSPRVQAIADVRGNQTRFLVVARQPMAVPAQVPARTTLMISTGQAPGALVEALVVLRDHGLSMTRLESRPIRGNPWEEMFHIDVDGNVDAAPMQAALGALRRTVRTLRVLGCYPVESVVPTPVPRAARTMESVQPGATAALDTESPQRAVVLGSGGAALRIAPGAALRMATIEMALGDTPDLGRRAARSAADAGADGLVARLPTGWAAREPVHGEVTAWLQAVRGAGLPLVVAVRDAGEVAATETCADAVWCTDDAGDDTLQAAARRARPVFVEASATTRLRARLAAVRTAGNQLAVAVLGSESTLAAVAGLASEVALIGAVPQTLATAQLGVWAAALAAAGAAGVVGTWSRDDLPSAMAALATRSPGRP